MKPQIQALLTKAQAYLGVQGGSPAHRALIDAYNAVQPLPVGYAVTYDDDWCDVFVTVMGDQAGIAHLIGRECGVPRHLTWCQEQGIWLGNVWPQAGDLIFFDFGGGPASHIGIVESVDGDSETVNTIEGNWLNQVVRRHYASDDWRILGYARPRYDARAGSVATGSEAGGANHSNGCYDTDSDLDDLALSVIRGDWGNGQERVERLTDAGYDAQVVQELVNEKLVS